MRYQDSVNRVPPAGAVAARRELDPALGCRHREGDPPHRAGESEDQSRPFSLPTARPWPRRQPTRRSGSGTWPRAGRSADSGEATQSLTAIAFSPDGTKLASTEGLGPDFPTAGESPPLTAPIHVWDTATGRELRQWETDNNSRVCFSPDGTTLATVGGQVIRLWDVASGREIRPQTGHHSAIEDAAFTPDRSIHRDCRA